MRLLIADDEPLIRRGIQEWLNLSEIGMKKSMKRRMERKLFDCLKNIVRRLSCWILMARLDGLSVAKIKSLVPETKIAMITGYNYFDYAQKAIRIGVETIFLKPVSKKEISEIAP